ncbi:MAG: hypothetical protein DMF97_22050, partial [Acidobacteria bacterium]
MANGAYTVTPSKSGYAFTPTNQSVTVDGAPVSGVNFVAQSVGGSISGTINPAPDGAGTTVILGEVAQTTADSSGNYTLNVSN